MPPETPCPQELVADTPSSININNENENSTNPFDLKGKIFYVISSSRISETHSLLPAQSPDIDWTPKDIESFLSHLDVIKVTDSLKRNPEETFRREQILWDDTEEERVKKYTKYLKKNLEKLAVKKIGKNLGGNCVHKSKKILNLLKKHLIFVGVNSSEDIQKCVDITTPPVQPDLPITDELNWNSQPIKEETEEQEHSQLTEIKHNKTTRKKKKARGNKTGAFSKEANETSPILQKQHDEDKRTMLTAGGEELKMEDDNICTTNQIQNGRASPSGTQGTIPFQNTEFVGQTSELPENPPQEIGGIPQQIPDLNNIVFIPGPGYVYFDGSSFHYFPVDVTTNPQMNNQPNLNVHDSLFFPIYPSQPVIATNRSGMPQGKNVISQLYLNNNNNNNNNIMVQNAGLAYTPYASEAPQLPAHPTHMVYTPNAVSVEYTIQPQHAVYASQHVPVAGPVQPYIVHASDSIPVACAVRPQHNILFPSHSVYSPLATFPPGEIYNLYAVTGMQTPFSLQNSDPVSNGLSSTSNSLNTLVADRTTASVSTIHLNNAKSDELTIKDVKEAGRVVLGGNDIATSVADNLTTDKENTDVIKTLNSQNQTQ